MFLSDGIMKGTLPLLTSYDVDNLAAEGGAHFAKMMHMKCCKEKKTDFLQKSFENSHKI
jgi:hypothetical protein